MSIAQHPAIYAIQVYQRFISPYKGFRCAHAALHGGDSCSHAVKKLIDEYGIWGSRSLIGARFTECRAAYQVLLAAKDTEAQQDSERQKNRSHCNCDIADASCNILANLSPCRGRHSQHNDCLPDVCDCNLF